MRIEKFILAAAIAALATGPALADHGKVGAWKLTSETKLFDPKHLMMATPSQMAHAIYAQSTGSKTFDYCMKAEDVTATTLKLPALTDCTVTATEIDGQSISGKYVCDGQIPGKGTVTLTYDSAEHYTGQSQFTPDELHDIKWRSKYEGTWTGATCTP